MQLAEEKGVKFVLPTDVVAASEFSNDADIKTFKADEIQDGWQGLDIGSESVEEIHGAMSSCNTIIWNGPMGVFELSKFAKGTMSVASEMAKRSSDGAITIVGGGDSVAAIEKSGYQDQITHISTGGGAMVEMLEGKILPGVKALDDV